MMIDNGDARRSRRTARHETIDMALETCPQRIMALCPTRYYFNIHDRTVARCCVAHYLYEEHDRFRCRIALEGCQMLLLRRGAR
jgi:hypothetical protein